MKLKKRHHKKPGAYKLKRSRLPFTKISDQQASAIGGSIFGLALAEMIKEAWKEGKSFEISFGGSDDDEDNEPDLPPSTAL
jgi:hypothetical protein